MGHLIWIEILFGFLCSEQLNLKIITIQERQKFKLLKNFVFHEMSQKDELIRIVKFKLNDPNFQFPKGDARAHYHCDLLIKWKVAMGFSIEFMECAILLHSHRVRNASTLVIGCSICLETWVKHPNTMEKGIICNQEIWGMFDHSILINKYIHSL